MGKISAIPQPMHQLDQATAQMPTRIAAGLKEGVDPLIQKIFPKPVGPVNIEQNPFLLHPISQGQDADTLRR